MDIPPCDLHCETQNWRSKLRNAQKNRCDTTCPHTCSPKMATKEFPEYIGPEHFSLFEPSDYLYLRAMIESAAINIAYFLMGSTVVIILFHTLAFKYFWSLNLHIFLNTIGSQIFLPAYLLMQHPLDGAGVWMKWEDRQREAFIMRVSAILCVFLGSLFLLAYGQYRVVTIHSFFGFVTFIMILADAVVLISSQYIVNEGIKIIGEFICIPPFIFSSVSLITGIFRSGMMQWYPKPSGQIPIFLFIFCFAYTNIIVYRPVKNFLNMILD